MKSPLEQFEDLLRLREEARKAYSSNLHKMQTDWVEWQNKLFAERFPRRKVFRAELINSLPEVVSEFEARKAVASRMSEEKDLEEKQIEHSLNLLALQIKLVPSEKSIVATRIRDSDYRSMGFGAVTYARRNAEMRAENYERLGVKVKITTERGKTYRGRYETRTPITFVVNVWLTPIMLEVADRKPSIGLRDWMKKCWKKGINPRVMNPFLPYGLEEKLGIDYFGNDARKVS